MANATAAVVVSWEGGDATRRCVGSLLAQDEPLDPVIVVDNASGAVERSALREAFEDVPAVRLLLLNENRHFAGGMNAGAEVALSEGAGRILFLNNDTLARPGMLKRLVTALETCPEAGIVGPWIEDRARPGHIISAGEVHSLALLCLPRSLLRPRPSDQQTAYEVSGLMGSALLISRTCFEAVGGFSEEIQVYYEDVDFCLGARAKGYRAWVEPRAIVEHDGMRGFASGLTPWAAILKARNPWLIMRRHRARGAWLSFLPTYPVLILASMLGYLARGRRDVARGLLRGALAGARSVLGGPVQPVGSPREIR